MFTKIQLTVFTLLILFAVWLFSPSIAIFLKGCIVLSQPVYRPPTTPPIFTEGRGGGSVQRLFYEGDQKLQKVMNTIMNTEIMNTFQKTFVQDCSCFYHHYFPSSHVCFFIFLQFSFLHHHYHISIVSPYHHHHHKKHNLPEQATFMYFIDHQHEKAKKENQKCCFPRSDNSTC